MWDLHVLAMSASETGIIGLLSNQDPEPKALDSDLILRCCTVAAHISSEDIGSNAENTFDAISLCQGSTDVSSNLISQST